VSRRSLGRNKDRSIWRYAELLPAVTPKHRPHLEIGWTPLYKAARLGKSIGLSNLFLKDDGRNPSASFKDRAGAIAVTRALDLGRNVVAGASTGNAASSLANLAAGTKLKTVVFVPQSAPKAKIAQLLVFGAKVIAIKGTYDQAFDLCLEACEEYGWYNRNTGYNAFTREGKKTAAFEIIEQLGWKVPDYVFVPTGDGNILSGVWKGFCDFYRAGLISRKPKMVAVQAAKSDSIKRAFESRSRIKPVSGKTIADSISVSLPRDGEAAVQALRESKGYAISVTDKEILKAIGDVAKTEGVFVEPAAAAAAAGMRKARALRKIKTNDRVVVLLTGNGLKDIKSAAKTVSKPYSVRPNFNDFKKLIRKIGQGE
jgi:threonine synthase